MLTLVDRHQASLVTHRPVQSVCSAGDLAQQVTREKVVSLVGIHQHHLNGPRPVFWTCRRQCPRHVFWTCRHERLIRAPLAHRSATPRLFRQFLFLRFAGLLMREDADKSSLFSTNRKSESNRLALVLFLVN